MLGPPHLIKTGRLWSWGAAYKPQAHTATWLLLGLVTFSASLGLSRPFRKTGSKQTRNIVTRLLQKHSNVPKALKKDVGVGNGWRENGV